MASGEMSQTEFANFLTQALLLHARYSMDGSLHFMCMDWRHMVLRTILRAKFPDDQGKYRELYDFGGF